jgi:PIN domain nuclease of toxin-antitoxin system
VKLLLEAHALIWAVDDPLKLGAQGATELNDLSNDLLVSAGTIWEIWIKVGLGKLALSLPFGQWMKISIADLGAAILPIQIEHADAQTQLPGRGVPSIAYLQLSPKSKTCQS